MRRQLDERGKKVLTFLDILLHFLSKRKTAHETRAPPPGVEVNFKTELTADTTVTLVGGLVTTAGDVLVRGAGGTTAGLAAGVPPVVITVKAF